MPIIFLFAVGNICHQTDPNSVTETPPDDCPSYDTDCDLISNAVENNSANAYLGLNPLIADNNPTLAKGFACVNGSLEKGLNMVDVGSGYYHYPGGDPTDTDDWGVLNLIYLIERVGRAWNLLDEPPRIGVGDLSLQNGGIWVDHDCHQNGLEVDVRYVRNDKLDLGLNISLNPELFDGSRTAVLLRHFISYEDVEVIYVDTVNSSLHKIGYSFIKHVDGHSDHFHVRIADPDGTGN